MRGISWLAANRLAFQEELCSMERVSTSYTRCKGISDIHSLLQESDLILTRWTMLPTIRQYGFKIYQERDAVWVALQWSLGAGLLVARVYDGFGERKKMVCLPDIKITLDVSELTSPTLNFPFHSQILCPFHSFVLPLRVTCLLYVFERVILHVSYLFSRRFTSNFPSKASESQ